MSAKKMFEELGYELKEETKKYLRYKKGISKYDDGAYIEFDLSNKMIRLYTKTPQYNNNPRYADYREFEAINKQIEELHWNDTTININVKLDGKRVMEGLRQNKQQS